MGRITKNELSPALVTEIEAGGDLTPIEQRLNTVEQDILDVDTKTGDLEQGMGNRTALVTPTKSDIVGAINSHVLPSVTNHAKHNYYVSDIAIADDIIDISYIADFANITTGSGASGIVINLIYNGGREGTHFKVKLNSTLTLDLNVAGGGAFNKIEANTPYSFICYNSAFFLVKGGNGGGTGTGSWGNVDNSTINTLRSIFKSQLASPYDIRGIENGNYIRIVAASNVLSLETYDPADSLLSKVTIPAYVVGTHSIAFLNAVSNDYFDVVVRMQSNSNVSVLTRYDLNMNVLRTLTITAGSAGQANILIGFLSDDYYLAYSNALGTVAVFDNAHTTIATLTGTSNNNLAHLRNIGDGIYSYNQTSNVNVYSVIRIKDGVVDAINNLQPFQMVNYLAQLSGY